MEAIEEAASASSKASPGGWEAAPVSCWDDSSGTSPGLLSSLPGLEARRNHSLVRRFCEHGMMGQRRVPAARDFQPLVNFFMNRPHLIAEVIPRHSIKFSSKFAEILKKEHDSAMYETPLKPRRIIPDQISGVSDRTASTSALFETMSELTKIMLHQRCLRYRWCLISGIWDTSDMVIVMSETMHLRKYKKKSAVSQTSLMP